MSRPIITRTSCRGCHGVCQVLVHHNGKGEIFAITGDPDSPTSKGFICPKGTHAAELLYHQQRLQAPLRRAGERGQGRWDKIAWDEAVDILVENFDRARKESGPEYIAIAQGTGRPYTEFTGRLCHALGSPNHVSPGHNCFVPRTICAGLTMGWFPAPDIYGPTAYNAEGQFPRCLLIFGSNVMETGAADGYCGHMVEHAFEMAGETIVIDPRTTKAARSASMHLAPRPGTECALILGMLHVIIRDTAYDKDFVSEYCVGFDELAAHAQTFTPVWAEKTTGVPAALIERAALSFASVKPAAMVWGNGIDESVCAFQTARAVYILLALCGTLDVPGGMVKWVPPTGLRPKSGLVDPGFVQGLKFLPEEQKAKRIGSQFPFCPGAHPPSFWQACVSGKPYRPKALWIIGSNPILTHTRGDLVVKALREHLEFVAVSDFFLTPTAELADLVLPAAHWLEQDDVVYFHKVWCVPARKKLAQIGCARDDREVILEVARKLGLSEAFPWAGWTEYLNWILEPAGLNFNDFAAKEILFGQMRYKKYEEEGFPTPSGKVELASSIMANMGLEALPVYTEPPLSPISRPDLIEEFPFILMTGCKIKPFFHSEGRSQASLRRLHPEPLLELHPLTAQKLNIANGTRVRVITPGMHGPAPRFTLRYDERLRPDVVHAEHAWWFPERPGPEHGCFISNANMLFSHEHFDPLSGAEPLKCSLCRVEKLGASNNK